MPVFQDLPINTRIAIVMGRNVMTAYDVFRRLSDLSALPNSRQPLEYIGYLLSKGASESPPRFFRTPRRGEFTLNHEYDWGAEATRYLRDHTLLSKPKPARPPAKLYTPKTAWARVIEDPIGDD